MTVGKTHDIRVFVGNADTLLEPSNILGMSLNGTAVTSRQSYLNEEFDQAGVHLINQEITFSTVYGTDDFDSLISALLGSSGADRAETMMLAVVADRQPTSWQLIPITFARPSLTAPPNDAITRPWGMMQSGRGMFGMSVTPFGPTVDGTALALGNSQDGTTIADAVNVLIITDKTGTITELTFTDAGTTSSSFTVPDADEDSTGIYVIDDGNAAGAASIESTGGTVTGFYLKGRKEVLPNG